MSRRMISTTIYLEPEMKDALEDISHASGVPMAEWIRRGVAHVLAMQPAKKRKRKARA